MGINKEGWDQKGQTRLSDSEVISTSITPLSKHHHEVIVSSLLLEKIHKIKHRLFLANFLLGDNADTDVSMMFQKVVIAMRGRMRSSWASVRNR